MKKFAHIFSAFIIICGMSVPGNTFATKHTVLTGNFTLVLPGDLPEEPSVKVYDMDGRVVYEKLLAGRMEYPINLSEAHAGTYFIRLHNGINNFVQRLVITP